MTTVEEQIELRKKIMLGLEIAYKRLIEFKKHKNSYLVVMQGEEIVLIKPK